MGVGMVDIGGRAPGRGCREEKEWGVSDIILF